MLSHESCTYISFLSRFEASLVQCHSFRDDFLYIRAIYFCVHVIWQRYDVQEYVFQNICCMTYISGTTVTLKTINQICGMHFIFSWFKLWIMTLEICIVLKDVWSLKFGPQLGGIFLYNFVDIGSYYTTSEARIWYRNSNIFFIRTRPMLRFLFLSKFPRVKVFLRMYFLT